MGVYPCTEIYLLPVQSPVEMLSLLPDAFGERSIFLSGEFLCISLFKFFHSLNLSSPIMPDNFVAR